MNTASAQLPPLPSAPLHRAYFAFSEGRYVEALESYLRIVNVARDSTILAEIAVQTGELYKVHEVTDDGHTLVPGLDGRLLAFSRDTPQGEVALIYSVTPGEAPDSIDSLEGSRLALSAASPSSPRVAYLGRGDSTAIRIARLRMETARARRENLEFLTARNEVRWLEVTTAPLVVRDLQSGTEINVALGSLVPTEWEFIGSGELLMIATVPGSVDSGLFRVGPTGQVSRVDDLPGYKSGLRVAHGSARVVFDVPPDDPAPMEPGRRPAEGDGLVGVGVVDLATGAGTLYRGSEPAVSYDGSVVAFLRRPPEFEPDGIRYPHGPAGEIWAVSGDAEPRLLWITDRPVRSLSLSPDGSWVAYSHMPQRDWEIAVRPTSGPAASRSITNEVQHDLNPVFVARGTLLATKGEARHRRAYLYDFAGGPPLKLFDNNILRTITPEYEWVVGSSGDWIGVVAERDGDTVSPERGVYVVDLSTRVSREDLRTRITANLERERELQRLGEARFAPIDDSVRAIVPSISEARIQEYGRVLQSFGSKYVTQPGNRRARDYLVQALSSFGYTPVLQEFEAAGTRTANVVATLPGTEDPNVVYVISSHFDSSRRGPGADDNTSGTAALLEAARVLSNHPQRATLQFVFLTGEEAGLLGARAYVGRAGLQVVGVLNNDMVGWSNDHRLDNTIRYSNPGIRDVQHAAAARYSDLITYDAKYYKNTDAHAFFDAYGDVVGGIGSYPVLGNPNYHQATDRIETVNHRLIAEVSRTTVASIMALAHGPSRPTGLLVQQTAGAGSRVSWNRAPERAVRSYVLRYRLSQDAPWQEVNTAFTEAEVETLPDGAELELFSLSREGVESWDRARLKLEDAPSR